MHSWSAPTVPVLPGESPGLRLYDSASRSLRPSEPSGVARLYVCGITPYDATHLGHAATYVTFDLLNRVWRDNGLQVRYVQNVTDVDDPLLERAVATGQDWRALAERETALFREDMTALRVLPPDEYIGAVEAIPLVVDSIERLRERGATYEVDGDTYFSASADPAFGGVSHLGPEEMRAVFGERGGDPDRAGKKDPLDWLLWRRERPDDPSWETRLGPGRPGWHIECSSIALHYLGSQIDVQGGGRDLVFPHHEMGASEAQVLTGEQPFADHFVHVGMVGLDGEKMSKSRGNLVFVSALRREGHDPNAIRLALLAHHYRCDWEWTSGDLAQAEERLSRWREAVDHQSAPSAAGVLDAIRAALADDLDAPAALTAVDRWAEEARDGRGDDESAPDLVVAAVDALLGVQLRD